jgi:hypothetical protein
MRDIAFEAKHKLRQLSGWTATARDAELLLDGPIRAAKQLLSVRREGDGPMTAREQFDAEHVFH